MIDAKKGTYVDGHERFDVVEYCGKFLEKMVAFGFLNEQKLPHLKLNKHYPVIWKAHQQIQ